MFPLPEGRPALMGILNVTPDSFSDGGLHIDAQAAVESALRMMAEGADLIDVGGESTRPGANPVSVDEEVGRVMPVVEALVAQGVPVSIDTMKPEVALLVGEAGAVVINDVGGFRLPMMRAVAAKTGCIACAMHMKGEPRTMQANPEYGDVVVEVRDYLLGAAGQLQAMGVEKSKIWIDPGIGFGKTVEHNLQIIRSLGDFVATGYPVLFGASRKSFIGKILGGEAPLPTDERLEGTLAVQVIAQLAGVRIIRAHDVKASRRAIDMVASVACLSRGEQTW